MQPHFPFRVIHNIIPCNKQLYDKREKKNSSICTFLNKSVECVQRHEFWKFWVNWLTNLSNSDIKNQNKTWKDVSYYVPIKNNTKVFIHCGVLAKYHIYIQQIKAMPILTCMPTLST